MGSFICGTEWGRGLIHVSALLSDTDADLYNVIM